MALLARRGAALAARSLRAAATASPASTSVHRLPAAGSLGAARELPSTQFFLFETRRGFAKGKKSSMLDHMMVETADVKVALFRMAYVSVLDAHTLSVIPYDTSTMHSIENAIVSSPLGINPRPDGNRIIVAVPPLTKEKTQALCEVVTTTAEDFKQKIRVARQMALDAINKSSSMPKDDINRLEKEVEEITKKYIKATDDMCKAKEKQISVN